MHRRGMALLLVLGIALLSGCLQGGTPYLVPATISPETGHVPYQAVITADPSAQHYTFALPGGIIEQDSNTLLVTVDSLTWTASITCHYDTSSHTFQVTAIGTNPLPRIRTPIINGDIDRWFLRPFEQDLISFESLNGRGIAYDGECHVVSIDVEGGSSFFDKPFSVFYPPYEKGQCHALFRGLLHENAGIVYPCYTSIDSPEGLPYSPTHLEEGYPYIGWKNTNRYSWGGSTDKGQEILAQEGTIKVTVKDEFNRVVTGTFSIPILGLDFSQH